MKTLAILIIGIASVARADLIDETPGGFTNPPYPQSYINFLLAEHRGTTNQLAQATIDQNTVTWLPGGLFGPNQFSIEPSQLNAGIAWDLAGTGYTFHWATVGNGDTANLYHITHREQLMDSGTVTIDGHTTLTAIAFYGSDRLPESGHTFVLFLFGCGLVMLSHATRYQRE